MELHGGIRTGLRGALPVATPSFHRERFFDYQMQRVMAQGHARARDIEAAAAQVESAADMVSAFAAQADLAWAQGRWANAAFYRRVSEFFCPRGSALQRETYEAFIGAFDRAFADAGVERHVVAYGPGQLPALRVAASGPSKGSVVVFGGFDSLIEEFVSIWGGLAEAGYDVVAFDGPGQGGARALHGLPFDHDWEKPVAAVLDHFALSNVGLVGISMGGYWALRAAAFEPRIERVVAWPPVYDWLYQLPRPVRPLVRAMVRWRRFMNVSIRIKMWLAPIMRHTIAQALYVQGLDLERGDPPVAAVDWLLGMNARHIHAERVIQDVLLLGGEHDAFQPPILLEAQARALVNARSVSRRVFTAAEHADGHVQMGNLGLAIDALVRWLDDTGVA